MKLMLLSLGVLGAGLVALIGLELAVGTAPDLRSAAPARGQPPPAPSSERPPDRSAEWVAQSLARPLFSADRRPVPPDGVGQAGAGPAEPPRLTGILSTPAGRQAIFAGAERPVVVREGGIVAGFIVQQISDEAVTVAGPIGVRTLRPSFQDAPAAAGPAVAGNAPNRAFTANPAPSGLDILRNAARLAPPPPAGSPPLPEVGVDQNVSGPLGAGTRPATVPGGRPPGAFSNR